MHLLNQYILSVFCLLSSFLLTAQNRPNVVWFVSEDNSPYLGAYGDSIVQTPHLDAFSKKSVTYTNAFSNAPVCAPSRSTMITGMYPPTLGTQHMREEVTINESIQFFPKYLKEAGYFTTLRLKRDYNIPNQAGTWDVDDWWHAKDAFKGKKQAQPYFLFYNTWMSHEGRIHDYDKKYDYFKMTFEDLSTETVDSLIKTIHPIDPTDVILPPYLPDLPEIRKDLALYYECMQMLDLEFAAFMEDLKKQGELDNTIIIYSSDHGGVLGGSKRFVLESGLKIPLMIYFPEEYKHLAPANDGATTDRLVSFIDFAPTLLALAGVEPPKQMQGNNFLDSNTETGFTFGFRDRMDESYDLVRSIRNKEFRYVRNFNPHRPHGQHIRFLWRAANVQAWQTTFLKGKLTNAQATFFRSRPPEELYHIPSDPDCVNNLASDPKYQTTLLKMRSDLSHFLKNIKDVGFIPEGELYAAKEDKGMIYQDYANSLPLADIINAAEVATLNPTQKQLKKYMQSEWAAIRFWGAMGCLILEERGVDLKATTHKELKHLLNDSSSDVRVIAAEVLYNTKSKVMAQTTIENLLSSQNPYVVLRALNTLEATSITSSRIAEEIKKISRRDDQGKFRYAIRKAEYLILRFNQ